MATPDTCTIVTSQFGDRWVLILTGDRPELHGRVFYNYMSDGEPAGWNEAKVPWVVMRKHMYFVASVHTDQEIPKGVKTLMRIGAQ